MRCARAGKLFTWNPTVLETLNRCGLPSFSEPLPDEWKIDEVWFSGSGLNTEEKRIPINHYLSSPVSAGFKEMIEWLQKDTIISLNSTYVGF